MAKLPKPAKKSILDLMTPQEVERVKNRERILGERHAQSVNSEWMGIAELGFYYGWSAVKDFIDDVITIEQAKMLVKCAHKIHSGHVLDMSFAIAAGTANKKGSFEKIMKTYIQDMKV